MTAKQRRALVAELERIRGAVEGWADLLDPTRTPSRLGEESRIVVAALDQIGRQASKAVTVLNLKERES